MKLKTVRVRRSRPSALSLALALMLTMACVYLLSRSAIPKAPSDAAATQASGSADVHMEALDTAFLLEARSESLLDARVLAARCSQSGGAGLILADNNAYAVIRQAVAPENAGEHDLRRSAAGLTLKLQGSADEISAVSEAISFLYAQASETGSLAAALEQGDTNADSISSLLHIYRTQGSRALEGLNSIEEPNSVVQRLTLAANDALIRLDSAIVQPDPGKIRLIHAAACAEWISILEDFLAEAA